MSAEQSDLFDLPQGRRLRDQGMKVVKDHAGEQFRELYRAAVTRWFEQMGSGHTFNSETLRSVARAAGVGEPHHYNVWSAMAGSLIRGWLKTGAITVIGEAQAQRPAAHATKVTRYAKT